MPVAEIGPRIGIGSNGAPPPRRTSSHKKNTAIGGEMSHKAARG